MPRYRLTIEYNGLCFHGLQRQDGHKTVQGELEEAVFKFCGERVTLHAAGRTDTGVHADGQVVHIDLAKEVDPFRLQQAMNFYLKESGTCVLLGERVTEDFHARFSAQARQYFYRIINRRAPLTIEAGRAWHIIQPLDVAAMREAASYFIGTHDFTSFRSSECQGKTPIKTLDLFELNQLDERIVLRVKARSFLHNQVRIMIGSLVQVGKGLWAPEKIKMLLETKDRTQSGPTAPAEGLYFEKVFY